MAERDVDTRFFGHMQQLRTRRAHWHRRGRWACGVESSGGGGSIFWIVAGAPRRGILQSWISCWWRRFGGDRRHARRLPIAFACWRCCCRRRHSSAPRAPTANPRSPRRAASSPPTMLSPLCRRRRCLRRFSRCELGGALRQFVRAHFLPHSLHHRRELDDAWRSTTVSASIALAEPLLRPHLRRPR